VSSMLTAAGGARTRQEWSATPQWRRSSGWSRAAGPEARRQRLSREQDGAVALESAGAASASAGQGGSRRHVRDDFPSLTVRFDRPEAPDRRLIGEDLGWRAYHLLGLPSLDESGAVHTRTGCGAPRATGRSDLALLPPRPRSRFAQSHPRRGQTQGCSSLTLTPP
jgi:hypothetical protein